MAAPARPWLDAALDVEQRVDALLAEMTLDEKVGQTHQVANTDPRTDADDLRAGRIGSSLYASGATAGNERDAGVAAGVIDDIQDLAGGSRLGIPVLFGRDVIHGHRTVAPVPLGLAASFDPDLVRDVATIAAAEAVVDGIAWTFAPMVDLSEEPRWGRVAESFGEAPVLAGRLAVAAVAGFQGPDPSAPERIGACAKHFVGYGLSAGGRDYDTVSVGENTLRNLHLRPFRDAVEGGVLSVMASFNDVDGTPMHAHRRLLRDVLKGEWGFDGVVVADWNGVGQIVHQGVAGDLREATRLAIEAGVDLDMVSGGYLAHLADLVRDGEVDEALVDDACRRVLRMKFRLGLFDGAAAPGTRPTGNEPTDAGRATVRRAGVAAHVLVRNEGVLPLADDVSVLLTGGFVHEGEVLLGTWVLDGRGADVVSPAAGLGARLGERLTVDDGRFADRTLQLARVADVTVALVGEHQSRSGEANSVVRPPAASRPARPAALARRTGQAAGRRGLHRPTPRPHRGPRPRRRGAGRLAPRPRGGLGARRRAHRGRRPARPPPDDLPAVHRAHPDQHPPAADRAAHPGRRGPSRGSVRRRPDLPTAAVRLRPDLRVRRLRTPAGQRRHPGRGGLGDAVADGHQQRPAGVPRGRAGVLPRPRRAGDPAPGRALRLGGRGPGARRLRRGELRRSRRGPSPTPAPSSPSAWTTGRSCC